MFFFIIIVAKTQRNPDIEVQSSVPVSDNPFLLPYFLHRCFKCASVCEVFLGCFLIIGFIHSSASETSLLSYPLLSSPLQRSSRAVEILLLHFKFKLKGDRALDSCSRLIDHGIIYPRNIAPSFKNTGSMCH